MLLTHHRKAGSQASLQGAGWQGAGSGAGAAAEQGGAAATAAPLPPKPPPAPPGNGKASTISPSTPRAEMLLYEPLMEHRLHPEPLSDLLVSEHMVFTADHTGCVRTWLRPSKAA